MLDRAMIRPDGGLASPIETDHRGGIRLRTGVERLEARLGALLATMPGERLMRPTLGCAVWRILSTMPQPGPAPEAANEIHRSLERDEPGVVVREVRAVVRADDPETQLTYIFGLDPAERVPRVVLDVDVECAETADDDPVSVYFRLVLVHGLGMAVPGPDHRDRMFLWRRWEAD